MGENSSAAYIHMVHHLIEECLVFNMSKQDCVEILSKRANIQPLITSTVWDELEKENKEFFQTYQRQKEKRSQMEMKQRNGTENLSDPTNEKE